MLMFSECFVVERVDYIEVEKVDGRTPGVYWVD